MENIEIILSKEEMKKEYGNFYLQSNLIFIDQDKIPKKLHHLIPYAEFWGISDDLIRENLVDSAPKGVAENLSFVIENNEDELDDWLCGDESNSDNPCIEYVAFSAMRMAADFI